eukprot:CAMPEP_0178538376 /NCGR_PEP_ID=MMETSP0696-20121128/37073_1 /TAXON_ID=265572 /ORGANISM="Extubocellulus spinifer, Strain CCMP396" /LENGTH=265 /DNA_ID=CAMNT_0020170633 /DNA_START=259 /DNA_END=1056 /DNA_ORIENTATION=+
MLGLILHVRALAYRRSMAEAVSAAATSALEAARPRRRSSPILRLTSTATTRILVSNDRRIAATQRWLDDVVIGQKLCPFAPPVRSAPKLRLVASSATDDDAFVQEVAEEARLLVGTRKDNDSNADSRKGDDTNRPETTLLVLNEVAFPSISDFRYFVQLSWRLQAEAICDNNFASDLQLVLFHPAARHNTYGEDFEDAADYTIRSPHPTVHLLREVDVMKAVRGGYGDLEGLPSRNKAKLRMDGLERCRDRLEDCVVSSKRTVTS